MALFRGKFIDYLYFAAIYLLAVLGLGLLISTYCATQRQAILSLFPDDDLYIAERFVQHR